MERWDIYDKNKVRTGRTMERNHFNLADDEYHLTVLGVIRRPDGRFLITKRVMTKAWAPGWWEVSGGAAQAGEESEEAVRREVLEETGLDVNASKSAVKIPSRESSHRSTICSLILQFSPCHQTVITAHRSAPFHPKAASASDAPDTSDSV